MLHGQLNTNKHINPQPGLKNVALVQLDTITQISIILDTTCNHTDCSILLANSAESSSSESNSSSTPLTSGT